MGYYKTIHTLQTRAMTCTNANPVAEPSAKPVEVAQAPDGSLVLLTPGGPWNLATLIGVDSWAKTTRRAPGLPQTHCMDFGQGWVCTNMRELLVEALALVLGVKS